MAFENMGMGRLTPKDWEHVERYPFGAVAPETVKTVEKVLRLPELRGFYLQGEDEACVGFSCSWMMSLLNRGTRYVARWLWHWGQETDEWPETEPGRNTGTSVRAACDILREKGHVIWRQAGHLEAEDPGTFRRVPGDPAQGIATNRWATTVDEVRTALSTGTPVTIGVNWYSEFSNPKLVKGEHWIGRGKAPWGRVIGGHAVCLCGASDSRGAVKIVNTWEGYPLVWMPYPTLQALLDQAGECVLVTDR